MNRFGMQSIDFTAWGVIAAPVFFGRGGNAGALRRYADEGVWGISPQMVPQLSHHALPGTISMALKIHGPNFAIGNGPEAMSEGVLLAATLLSEGRLPGIWFVMTRFAPEYLPNDDAAGSVANNATGEGIAFALTPIESNGKGPEFLFSPDDEIDGALPVFELSSMVDQLQTDNPRGRWRLPGFGWFGIQDRPAAMEMRA